jgi:hypothetical protein
MASLDHKRLRLSSGFIDKWRPTGKRFPSRPLHTSIRIGWLGGYPFEPTFKAFYFQACILTITRRRNRHPWMIA